MDGQSVKKKYLVKQVNPSAQFSAAMKDASTGVQDILGKTKPIWCV